MNRMLQRLSLIPFMLASLCIATSRASAAPAEWTIMVFMDGDNDLECNAINSFLEMARIGSTNAVNLVVQLDRIKGGDDRFGDWVETVRFHVQKNMEPRPKQKYAWPIGEVNMGDGKELGEFVRWGMDEFEARRYALIMWDHGQGWLKMLRIGRRLEVRRSSDLLKELAQLSARTGVGSNQENSTSPFLNSISHDWTDKKSMFNREMAENLQRILKGRKLDILGFDACFMGMIEVAHAMRKVAKLMVASEEIVPTTSWGYKDISTRFNRYPRAPTVQLAGALVRSYEARYGWQSAINPGLPSTLSAYDLSGFENKEVGKAIDKLVHLLMPRLSAELENLMKARKDCLAYGQDDLTVHHIDFVRFCHRLGYHTKNAKIKKAAYITAAKVKAYIKANFAHPARLGKYGSEGLAIYFPPTQNRYANDRHRAAYRPGNKVFPVEFVDQHRWSTFLPWYFSLQPEPDCDVCLAH